MTKRILTLSLALLLTLTLAACGDDRGNGGKSDTQTPPPPSGSSANTPDTSAPAQTSAITDGESGIDGLPNNELTRLLPTPLPLVISEVAEDGSEDALVLYGTLTYEDAKAYIAKLEEIGFTENATYIMDSEKQGVSWTANKDGHYGISIGGGGTEDTGSLSLNKW